MIYVPILNDTAHTHLTKEDWESLAFSHVAIDVINLFLHPYYLIPSTTKKLFLDTRIRSCHKISRQKNLLDSFFLYSPHNGQKILITFDNIQQLLERFKNLPGLTIEVINEVSLLSEYEISEKAGNDAKNGLLYSTKEKLNIQDSKWAKVIEPIDYQCRCYTCKYYTLSYLHHLHMVSVPLGTRLSILHNLEKSKTPKYIS